MSPYPKRLETLLERIYEKYPTMRRNPDFKYFYLFQSYPNNVDTFIVLTGEVLDWDDEIHSYLRSITQMLGFEFAMMKWGDFDVVQSFSQDSSVQQFLSQNLTLVN